MALLLLPWVVPETRRPFAHKSLCLSAGGSWCLFSLTKCSIIESKAGWYSYR